MHIIPAIDIIDSKCVRLSQGDYQKKTVYSDSPVELAKRFESLGVRKLHLVDLDGAKAGSVQNLDILQSICAETSLQVDFGGGVKSKQSLLQVLESGARQVTGGSIAVKEPKEFKSWIKEYGAEKIILGADCRDLKISISGWQEESEIDVFDFISDYQASGIKYVIVTDISTDGMLKGPNFSLYQGLVEKFPQLKIIASGGVSSKDDLVGLEKIGLYGAITGKAIYESRIKLEELFENVN